MSRSYSGGAFTGDIALGAVELKDASADVRASIAAANTARTTSTIVIATQHIDAAGTVGGVTLNTLLAFENDSENFAYVLFKALATNTGALSGDVSAALEASTVTKASAGRIYKAIGRLDSTLATGTYYVQLLNAASLPADGAVTHLRNPIKIQHTAGTDDFWDFLITEAYGVYASTGIVLCLSTTEFTKTISGAYLSSSISFI